jgi:hypothetical protein
MQKSNNIRHKELAHEDHFEKYLIAKLLVNLRNHLKQRNISESDIKFTTEFAKNKITVDNIQYIYGKPMQLILMHLAAGTLSSFKTYTASYKTAYIKNHPHIN